MYGIIKALSKNCCKPSHVNGNKNKSFDFFKMLRETTVNEF